MGQYIRGMAYGTKDKGYWKGNMIYVGMWDMGMWDMKYWKGYNTYVKRRFHKIANAK
jgi:hypothetical protein